MKKRQFNEGFNMSILELITFFEKFIISFYCLWYEYILIALIYIKKYQIKKNK